MGVAPPLNLSNLSNPNELDGLSSSKRSQNVKKRGHQGQKGPNRNWGYTEVLFCRRLTTHYRMRSRPAGQWEFSNDFLLRPLPICFQQAPFERVDKSLCFAV
ncbi:hypothetical protein ACTXT7_016750 [Hymenolepis weldensis]